MTKVVVLGSIAIDVIDGGGGEFIGGKGLNKAVAAARLGAEVSLRGKVGNDAYGRKLISSVTELGIDGSGIKTDQTQPTTLIDVSLGEKGGKNFKKRDGANDTLTVEDVNPSFTGQEIVISELTVPSEPVLQFFREAKRAGSRTVLNPSPAMFLERCSDELMSLSDFVVINKFELLLLTKSGASNANVEGLLMTASRARREGQTFVITLGAEGVVSLDDSCVRKLDAIPRDNVLDRTGAGDCFTAGFATALPEGIDNALRFANIAAGISVQRLRGSEKFPTLTEVEKLMRTDTTQISVTKRSKSTQ